MTLEMVKEIIDQSVFSLTFLKYMKDINTNDQKLILNLSYLDVSVNSEKDLVYLTILLATIEKWKESLDSGGNLGSLQNNLSKAFDCLPQDLRIAKLHAYGLDMPSLKLLHSYLTKRRQGVKINNIYSSWSEILFEVSQ